MKLDANDFRVCSGATVDLKKWPTVVEPGVGYRWARRKLRKWLAK
jgi:hypothetical protein